MGARDATKEQKRLESRKGCKKEIQDEVEINGQVKLVEPRMKTGITVIICRFSCGGVYVDVKQGIILTISGNRSRLEEREAVLATGCSRWARRG